MKLGSFHLAIFPLAMICVAVTSMRAELRLSSVITDHAVLQRDAPIHLWGEASPAEKIAVRFHDQSVTTTASHLEQFRNYCGLIKIARCGFLWEKTTKRPIASVYTNCELL